MLGIQKNLVEEALNNVEGKSYKLANKFRERLFNGNVEKVNKLARKWYGGEDVFSGTLEKELMLFVDENYRKAKLDFYRNKIEPRISNYDDKKVEEAFERAREKEKKEVQDLDDLMD